MYNKYSSRWTKIAPRRVLSLPLLGQHKISPPIPDELQLATALFGWDSSVSLCDVQLTIDNNIYSHDIQESSATNGNEPDVSMEGSILHELPSEQTSLAVNSGFLSWDCRTSISKKWQNKKHHTMHAQMKTLPVWWMDWLLSKEPFSLAIRCFNIVRYRLLDTQIEQLLGW